ncbi:site-2 protease family protein [bacterium]|nr:site-2 protease family protein [bacterium]
MESVLVIISQVLILLVSISFHESAHAYAADKMGDPTAKNMGRITMNPLKHMDLWGTIILPILMLFLMRIPLGYAKPVPVNPNNFHDRKKGEIIVSLAGPGSNLLLAVVAAVILRLLLRALKLDPYADPQLLKSMQPLFMLLFYFYLINLFLAIFNLIPLPPLDGSHVLREFLSYKAKAVFDRIRPFSFIIILVLLNVGILTTIMYFFVNVLSKIFLGNDMGMINYILGA